jgi:lipoprotein NlpI
MQSWTNVVVFAAAGWLAAGQSSQAQLSDAEQWLVRAQQAASQQQSQQAVESATAAIERDPKLAEAYYVRGRSRFCLADFSGSATDFDRFVELRPAARMRLWERGISCYFAKRFQDGTDQFSAYQDFDDSDVENAVWHLMCLSQIHGLAEAQRQMMPVKSDARVPMAQIDRLFRGEGTIREVFQAATQAALSDDQRHTATFYAHLYVGLFHEISGDETQARQHVTDAAEKFRVPHYMWHVARVHKSRWQPASDSNP